MEQYERAFLAASAVALVIFLCALGYGSVAMGVHLPSHGAMIHYEAGQKLRMVLRHTPPFDHPGVHEVAPGKSAGCGISRRTRNDAGGLHSFYSADPGRVSSSVRRPRGIAATEVHRRGPDLCDFLSQPDDRVRSNVCA